MKKILVAALLFAATSAHAVYDTARCEQVFKQAAVNPYRLTIGELDDVQVCAASLKNIMVNERENDREIRAYERMNNKTVVKKLTDSE